MKGMRCVVMVTREAVGFLDADVCGVGAEQAGEDEDAGAECEFEFKLHDGASR